MSDVLIQKFEMIGQTGFQSATNEYGVKRLSLDALFGLKSPSISIIKATQAFTGKNFKIASGDILVIDKKLNTPKKNGIFAFSGAGDFYIGEYSSFLSKPHLRSQISPEFDFESDYEVLGGVVAIINIYAKVTCPVQEISLDEVFSLHVPNIYLWRADGGVGRKFQVKGGDILIVDRKLYELKPDLLYVYVEGKNFELSMYSHINLKPFLVPQMIPIENKKKIEEKVWGGIVAIINLYSNPDGLK